MQKTLPPPGSRFQQALKAETPLQIVGTINAISALLAEQAGFRAIYLSGAGVANASHGLPDLGITTLHDVIEETRRITNACDLPLLVDLDTGWGSAFNIARAIQETIQAGAAAAHLEDQVFAKRCGHRPNKEIVSTQEMMDRIKAAVDARTDETFIIMARTDALHREGLDATIERIQHYVEAGADMIFFEGATELNQYQTVTTQCKAPVLANLTEFGVTPLLTTEQLKNVGVRMALYPLSAFRAMNAAALQVYLTLRREGTQKTLVPNMQTREALYDLIDYYAYEKKLDELFSGDHHE